MPIIGLILSSLLLWTGYWFFRMGGLDRILASRALRKDMERVVRARESQHAAPLTAVEDPRDAAIILMLLMAREGGDPTREHIAMIEKTARAHFGFGDDLGARMTQARFAASRAQGFAHASALFADLFNRKLTAAEKRELVEMVEEVADFEGGGETRAEHVGGLCRRIGLAPAR
jgi:hypothetical protein